MDIYAPGLPRLGASQQRVDDGELDEAEEDEDDTGHYPDINCLKIEMVNKVQRRGLGVTRLTNDGRKAGRGR